MPYHLFLLAALFSTFAAISSHAQHTQRWSEPQSGPLYTEHWSDAPASNDPQESEMTATLNTTATSSATAVDALPVDINALPRVPDTKIAGQVEIRSACHTLFVNRTGPQVPIRWFGISQTVTLIGRRSDDALCALYEDGSSEWIASSQVMTAAEKLAHDQDMQELGAGLQRQGNARDAAQDTMDKLRDTGNALHDETQKQYRETERYYEERRRFGP